MRSLDSAKAPADEQHNRITRGARLAYCLLIVLLGATVYQTVQAGK